MPKRVLDSVIWYVDPLSEASDAPGIWNSFVSCLCAALAAKGEPIDPAQVMGDTAWAFRILAHKEMCPSAMSVFDFTGILTQSVEQLGYRCQYVSRYWHEGEVEEARRLQAQDLILKAIDRGDPAIVWDLPPVPEWGLIVGYDTDAAVYHTLGVDQKPATIGFCELGQRGIPILSVTMMAEPNDRTEAERRLNALCLAVRHGRHKEWIERPDYEDGPEAFDVWAAAVERGVQPEEGEDFSRYYAGHYAGARAYAVTYLERCCDPSDDLQAARGAYAQVAELLGKVYGMTPAAGYGDDKGLRREVAALIRQAGAHEREALDALERHVATAED